jgi:hypothetical protein
MELSESDLYFMRALLQQNRRIIGASIEGREFNEPLIPGPNRVPKFEHEVEFITRRMKILPFESEFLKETPRFDLLEILNLPFCMTKNLLECPLVTKASKSFEYNYLHQLNGLSVLEYLH